MRDEGLLLSAIARPENAYHYSDPKPDIAEIAAAYGFGLACPSSVFMEPMAA
ncbi:hypothetical protein [Rhodophyticola sp. SM2404]